MEAELLLRLHALAHPLLDALFVASDALATLRFSAGLILTMIAWHLLRREPRAALVWLGVGLAALALQSGLKPLFGRPRPELWPPLVAVSGAAMPSGHALASAAFYPLLAFALARAHPAGARAYRAAGLLLPLVIGVGRLYLGVHWPSDVLVGWALGAALSALAARAWEPRAATRDL